PPQDPPSFPTRRSSDLLFTLVFIVVDFSAVRGCVFGVIRCGGVVSCMFRVICVIRMGCVLVGVRIVMFITSVRRFGLALQCWLVDRKSTRLNSSHVKSS